MCSKKITISSKLYLGIDGSTLQKGAWLEQSVHLSQRGHMALDHCPLTCTSDQPRVLFPRETLILYFSRPWTYIKSKITICHKLLIKVPSSFQEKWIMASFWPSVLIYSLIYLKISYFKYNLYCLLLSHIIHLHIHAFWLFVNLLIFLRQ